MKQFITALIFVFIGIYSASSQTIMFDKHEDYKTVIYNDTLVIKTDTAYILNKSRAAYINQKLDELDEIKQLYNGLVSNRNELLGELKKTHKLLSKLSNKMEQDSLYMNENLSLIIDGLNESLNELKINNEALKSNNTELVSRIKQLETLVGELKRETRGIWWNGITDKVVVFAGGIATGLIIALLL